MWTADLQWYQKEKSWSANSLWEQLSWIFLFKHSLDFFPLSYKPFFFHIRGFSLALPSSKSHRESAAPSTYPALQSRGISNISVISIKPCMAKYTWWLQNFSMWPGNFNTTASAGSSKRQSFCYLLCFFQRKKGFVACSRAFSPPVFTPPSQYHTHLIQQKQMRCELLQRWMPAARGAVLQLYCPTTKTLCRKGVDAGSISDRVIWSNSNKKKELCFYLLCFYLLPHHNHFLAWLLCNHKINGKPLTFHSVKMYSTSGIETGERISDGISSKKM